MPPVSAQIKIETEREWGQDVQERMSLILGTRYSFVKEDADLCDAGTKKRTHLLVNVPVNPQGLLPAMGWE